MNQLGRAVITGVGVLAANGKGKDEFWTTLTLVSLRTCTPFCLHRGVPRAWWTRRVLRELMCATFIDEDEEQMLGLLLLL